MRDMPGEPLTDAGMQGIHSFSTDIVSVSEEISQLTIQVNLMRNLNRSNPTSLHLSEFRRLSLFFFLLILLILIQGCTRDDQVGVQVYFVRDGLAVELARRNARV